MARPSAKRQTRSMHTTPPAGGPADPHGAGPHEPHGTGPHGAGPHGTGPHGTGPHGTGTHRPSNGGFFAWLRGLGIIRGQEHWFAGVAGGIAAKAGIDPLIVRGAFVVLALLGGPGLLLYLAGWLLLPDDTGRIHAEDIVRGRASAGVLTGAIVLVGVVVFPAFLGMVFGAGITPSLSIWGWGVWDMLGFPHWLRVTIAWCFWLTVLVAAGFWVHSVLLQRGRDLGSQRASAPSASSEPSSPASSSSAPSSSAPSSPASSAPPQPGAESAPAGGATFSAGTDPSQTTTAHASSAGAAYAEPGTSAGFSAGTDAGPNARASSSSRPGSHSEDWARDIGERTEQWGRDFGERANRWGADVGRQADEWTARYSEHHDAHKLGAGHVVISLACALLAGGAAALQVSSLDTAAFEGKIGTGGPPALVAGITAALAVLAISLIVAGVRGRHTGWIGFLSFCGVVGLFATVALPVGSTFQPFGTVAIDGQRATGTVVVAGTTQVDLSDLDLRTDASDIVVWQLAGRSDIVLPENAAAQIEVRVLAGRVGSEEAGRGEDSGYEAGVLLRRSITVDPQTSANRDDSRGSTDQSADAAKPAEANAPAQVSIYLLGGDVTFSATESSSSAAAKQLSTVGAASAAAPNVEQEHTR